MKPSTFRVVASCTMAAIVSLVPSVLGVEQETRQAACKNKTRQ
jgi:hypothetical protein